MTQTNELPANLKVLFVEEVVPLLRMSHYQVRRLARLGRCGFRKEAHGKRYFTTQGAVEAYLRGFERTNG